MTTSKIKIIAASTALALVALTGCASAADQASSNISKAADDFRILRRVVFFNGITDTYLLVIEGRCSILDEGTQLEVTCKINDDAYAKHFLGLSDNVTYFAEQIEVVDVSEYHHKVIFRPETLLPSIELRTSVGETP